MKSILIMDNMPSNCYECPLCCCDSEYDYICSALTTKAKDDYTNDEYEIVTEEEWVEERYSKCPLKSMPDKFIDELDCPYGFDYMMGWDECIEEILGKENESNINN